MGNHGELPLQGRHKACPYKRRPNPWPLPDTGRGGRFVNRPYKKPKIKTGEYEIRPYKNRARGPSTALGIKQRAPTENRF